MTIYLKEKKKGKEKKKKKVTYFWKIVSVLKDFKKLLSISSYNQIQVYEVEIRIGMVGVFFGGVGFLFDFFGVFYIFFFPTWI